MNFGVRIGVTNGDEPLGGLAAEGNHTIWQCTELRDAKRLQCLRVEVHHGSMLGRGDLDENMCEGHFQKEYCSWITRQMIKG